MDNGRAAPAAWAGLRARLMALKRPIFDEIRNYPPQIAGCDLHFKDLAEKRDAICRELAALEELREAGPARLHAFSEASAFLKGGGTA